MKNKIEEFCPNYANLSDREKRWVEEEYYRIKKFKHSYSVAGVDYKPKYDTGEVINGGEFNYNPKTKQGKKKVK